MSCINCNEECKADIRNICRVCELLDGDSSIKRVCYCNECGAYICYDCRPNPLRRVGAAVANATEKAVDKVVEVLDKLAEAVRPKRNKRFSTNDFGKEDEGRIEDSDQA